MKKIILMAMAALLFCSGIQAQSQQESINERRQSAQLSEAALNKRASKAARKEARTLKKEGWKVAPGQLPLDKQLDRSYNMYYEYDENGLPAYIFGDAMSPGKTYDAAKMQALEIAKTNLAGHLQTEIAALIESTVANDQLSMEDAESITRTVQASKNLIVQRLGRVVTVVECYRQVDKVIQVRATIAYNAQMAMKEAKVVIKKQLEEKGKDLHNQLDAIWSQLVEAE